MQKKIDLTKLSQNQLKDAKAGVEGSGKPCVNGDIDIGCKYYIPGGYCSFVEVS